MILNFYRDKRRRRHMYYASEMSLLHIILTYTFTQIDNVLTSIQQSLYTYENTLIYK